MSEKQHEKRETKSPASAISPADEAALEMLDRLVGSWATEGTHPAIPGITVRGTADAEWLEGERFLMIRARVDHPDFPDSISIIGFTDRDRVAAHASGQGGAGKPQLAMHYYDSRGVHRELDASIDAERRVTKSDPPGGAKVRERGRRPLRRFHPHPT